MAWIQSLAQGTSMFCECGHKIKKKKEKKELPKWPKATWCKQMLLGSGAERFACHRVATNPQCVKKGPVKRNEVTQNQTRCACTYLDLPVIPVKAWHQFFFFVLLGPHHSIWRFPGYPANWSCSHSPTPQPQQCGIQAASGIYTTAQGNARSLTQWAKPGIEPTSSQMLMGFVNHWATTGTPLDTNYLHGQLNGHWMLKLYFQRVNQFKL